MASPVVEKAITTLAAAFPAAAKETRGPFYSVWANYPPLSVASQRVSSYTEAIKETESFRNIVESVSAASDAMFPRASEEDEAAPAMTEAEEAMPTEEAAPRQRPSTRRLPRRRQSRLEQDKLDRAAEMAKKALDAGAPPEGAQEAPAESKASTLLPAEAVTLKLNLVVGSVTNDERKRRSERGKRIGEVR